MTIYSDTGSVSENRGPGPDSGSSGEPSVDRLFEALAAARRRRVLRFLADQPEGTAADAELVDAVIDRAPQSVSPEPRSVEIELHHCHLPKLESAGLIEYEPDDGVVRYREDDRLEELLGLTTAFERP